MGRLEEYKELQSSIKWMIFDIVYDAQDVSLKTADVFILLNVIGQAHDIFSRIFPITNLQYFSTKYYVTFFLIFSYALN